MNIIYIHYTTENGDKWMRFEKIDGTITHVHINNNGYHQTHFIIKPESTIKKFFKKLKIKITRLL